MEQAKKCSYQRSPLQNEAKKRARFGAQNGVQISLFTLFLARSQDVAPWLGLAGTFAAIFPPVPAGGSCLCQDAKSLTQYKH